MGNLGLKIAAFTLTWLAEVLSPQGQDPSCINPKSKEPGKLFPSFFSLPPAPATKLCGGGRGTHLVIKWDPNTITGVNIKKHLAVNI